jgi:two-component system, probable response regulator PhcQ
LILMAMEGDYAMTATVNQDISRFKILYVDDELLSLKYFQQIVSEDFQVITASSAEEGLRVLEQQQDSIAVVISDQKLHGMQGTSFLATLRVKYPDIIRILATAYADIATAVSAINDGAIYHYISKPWEPESLVLTLRRSMERFVLRAEKESLLQEKAEMVRQLITSDRLAGYGVLAEGINHHLRNALVPVEIYLQIAGQSQAGDAEDQDAEFLNQLHTAARTQVRRITEMLDRLASVSRVNESSKEELVSVEDLWNEVQGQLAGAILEKGVKMHLTAAPGLPRVRCNHARLSYVLRLLVEDELAHLQPTNEVRVLLKQGAESVEEGAHVCLEISDTGPDIDPSRLPLMFTPFFVRQETPQYVGMNLAICYVTLDSLGGWARAYHDAERGTVLAFFLPVQPTGRSEGSKPLLDAWGEAMESVDAGNASESMRQSAY